jgi:hypothetical protein
MLTKKVEGFVESFCIAVAGESCVEGGEVWSPSIRGYWC